MYWQDVTLVDSMAPTLICYLVRWSLTLQKQAFSYLCKAQVFFSKIFDKKHLLLSKFTHQVLTYENWGEEILEQLQHHITQNCP
jgi:hypothetical protein